MLYQKHMTHHMVPGLPLDWMADVRHAFLIRDPRDVILSYMQRRPDMTTDDIGFVRQTELFDHVCAITGETPPVIDARDVLVDPRDTRNTLGFLLETVWETRHRTVRPNSFGIARM